MYTLQTTNQFKKDYKLCQRRGLKIELIHKIFLLLEKDGKVTEQYKPHRLKGIYRNYWECHITPDWLLIWNVSERNRTIDLIRTGSHSDPF